MVGGQIDWVVGGQIALVVGVQAVQWVVGGLACLWVTGMLGFLTSLASFHNCILVEAVRVVGGLVDGRLRLVGSLIGYLEHL